MGSVNRFGADLQMGDIEAGEDLLTPAEVASLFRVDSKTVGRWHQAGRIVAIRTPGGHRRFRKSDIKALLEGDGAESTPLAER